MEKKKMSFLKNNKYKLISIGFLFLFSLVFLRKAFFNNLITLPADILVGVYYPWRDNIWNNLVAGVPIKNFELSDAVSQFYPWKLLTREILKTKQIPLWNHLTLSGAPFLATYHSAVLYPLNLLYLVIGDTITAWNLQCFFQIFFSALFTFLFLSNLKIGTYGSIIGAISFSLSGYMMTWLTFGPGSQAGLWLPLILLAIDKFKENHSFRWTVIGTFALAMMLLAGDFQTPFYSLILIFFYGFFRRNFRFVLLVSVLGAMISSPQLLPTIELYLNSIRQGDNYISHLGYGIIPWRKLIQLFVPDFFGNPTTGNFWAGNFYFGEISYIGVVALVSLTFLLKRLKDKEVRFFGLFTFISLTFIFPFPWAKLPYIFNLPLLASSSANRMLFLPNFTLSILAGFGVDFLVRNGRNLKTEKLIKTLMPLWIIYGGIFLGTLLSFLLFKKGEMEGVELTIWIQNLSVSLRNLVLPLGIVFLSSSAIFLFCLFKKNLFLYGLLLISCFDLWRFGSKYTPFTSREYVFPEIGTTQWLKNQPGVFRVAGEIPSNFLIPYGISSAEGYESMYPSRYSKLLALDDNNRKFGRYVDIGPSERLADLLNIKYFITFKKGITGVPDSEGKTEDIFLENKFKKVFEENKTVIFENNDVLPRAFLVFDYETATAEAQLKEMMAKRDFDFSKNVILEEEIEDYQEANKRELASNSKINFLSYTPNEVVLEAESDKPGILVLLDSYYPGWRALIDNGTETKIYRADFNFRAVLVPSGKHIVKFVYDPLSFKIGVYLSFAALFSISAAAAKIFFYDKIRL